MGQDMHKSLVELIHFAESVGWTRKVLVNGTVELTSTWNRSVVRVPKTRSMNAAKLSTITGKIVRGTDPKLVAMFNAANDASDAGVPDHVLAEIFPDAEKIAETYARLEDTEDEIRREHPPVEEPVIVSEAPWLAHKRPGTPSDPGQLYESATTIERMWSDGHRDYKCTAEGCEYTNRKARSVAMHYGAKHSRVDGKVVKPAHGDELDDPTYVEPLSRRSAVTRLAREIELALRSQESLDVDSATLAHRVAEEIVRRRIEARMPIEGTADEPREEMTPEEIVAAVRKLVDRGHVAQLEARLTAMEADQGALVARRFEEESLRVQAEQRAAAAEAHAGALQERLHQMSADLSAVRELFNSIAPEGEKV